MFPPVEPPSVLPVPEPLPVLPPVVPPSVLPVPEPLPEPEPSPLDSCFAAIFTVYTSEDFLFSVPFKVAVTLIFTSFSSAAQFGTSFDFSAFGFSKEA